MKHLMLLIFTFNFGISLMANPTYDYISYNRFVNSAELAITAGNYPAASSYYDSAFAFNGTPSPLDLQNAAVVAINRQDENKAFLYANKLASLGVKSTYFKKNTIFKWMSNKAGWNSLLQNSDSSFNIIRSKNADLISVLGRLSKSCDSIRRQYYTNGTPSVNGKTLREKEYQLAKSLHQIFEEHGYLSTGKIGVNIIHDTLIADPIFTEIIAFEKLSYTGTNEIVYNEMFLPILKGAMEAGLITSDFLIRNVSCKFSADCDLPAVRLIECGFYAVREVPVIFENADASRKIIGLPTYQEYLEKLRFNIRMPDSPFILSSKADTFAMSKYSVLQYQPDYFATHYQIGIISNCKESTTK